MYKNPLQHLFANMKFVCGQISSQPAGIEYVLSQLNVESSSGKYWLLASWMWINVKLCVAHGDFFCEVNPRDELFQKESKFSSETHLQALPHIRGSLNQAFFRVLEICCTRCFNLSLKQSSMLLSKNDHCTQFVQVLQHQIKSALACTHVPSTIMEITVLSRTIQQLLHINTRIAEFLVYGIRIYFREKQATHFRNMHTHGHTDTELARKHVNSQTSDIISHVHSVARKTTALSHNKFMAISVYFIRFSFQSVKPVSDLSESEFRSSMCVGPN